MTRRTVLFTPGDRPDMLRNAPDVGADVVVFDLEDAVAPDRKPDARETIRDVLSDRGFDPSCEVCVRVNTGSTVEADLATVLDGTAPDSVMLPKATSVDDVNSLDELVRDRDDPLPILALIETARGVLAAPEIAAARATDALVFGAEDLSADIGATRTADGTEVLYARERVVLAASAADVNAIDTVYTDIEDADGLAEEARFAVQLGYDGKMAIHPAQVDPINDAFTPAPERIAWARRVLTAREDADEQGVFRVDDEMIDAPMIERAERIVERARAAEEL